MVYIKEEEFIDDCSLNDTLGVKEEIASICDDEGYILNARLNKVEIKEEPDVFYTGNSDVEDDKNFSLGFIKNDETVLDHPVQDGTCSLLSEVQIKRKRKPRKVKNERKAKSTEKDKGFVTRTGRTNKDEFFKDKEYFCSLCQKLYLGRKFFKKHFKEHIMVCQNRYTCLICHYTANNVSHINRHLLETHFLHDLKNDEGEKMFICAVCTKRFFAKKELERHMFVHTGQGNLKCVECDFSTMHKMRLAAHMSCHGYPNIYKKRLTKNDENGGSEFKCHYCSYSSESKSSLTIHIKRHLGHKGFKCPDCNYKCSDRSDLRKHCTIHSDDKPFICDQCSKSFKRRSHLLIHFNRKYSCSPGGKYNYRERVEKKEIVKSAKM